MNSLGKIEKIYSKFSSGGGGGLVNIKAQLSIILRNFLVCSYSL